MIRTESAWSVLPHEPNIIAPRHSGLTETPVRPSRRRSISGGRTGAVIATTLSTRGG